VVLFFDNNDIIHLKNKHMSQNTDKRNIDPGVRGLEDQNQIVNEQDQNTIVNPGPGENDQRNERSNQDRLIDHSLEKEGEEETSPEIETPSRNTDSGEESTEKKIPHF
jgi:hypothetical protein